MEITIPLPNSFSISTYSELKNYLKQLELCVHHAQKAMENAEEEGLKVTENAYVCFEHPSLSEKQRGEDYDELQNVELHINIA